MTDIYIDPSSATNGSGTIGDPKNTWAGLTWAAGNRYMQKRGTTFVSAAGSGGRIAPSASGTAAARIVLGAYGDAAAPLPIIQSNADTGINLDQRSFITVEQLDIIGSTISGIGGGGAAGSPMAGVIVRRNRVRNAGNMGMSFQTQLDRQATVGLVVIENEIIAPGYHGIHIMGEHVGTLVKGNRISGGGLLIPGHGITVIPHRATSTPTWTLVSGSIYSTPIGAQSYKTTVSEIYGVRYAATGVSLLRNTATPTTPANGEFGFAGGLLYINVGGVPSGQITFSYTSVRATVCDNEVRDYGSATDSESKGIQLDDLASDCEIARNQIINPRAEGIACNMGQRNRIVANLVVNPRDQGIRADINGARDNLVYHNTVVAGADTQSGMAAIQLGLGNTAKNNLMVGFSVGINGASAACIAANNAYWQCGAQSSGTLTDQGGNVTANPGVDYRYEPAASSPLVGAGQVLGCPRDVFSRPYKAAPAIGAVEYMAARGVASVRRSPRL